MRSSTRSTAFLAVLAVAVFTGTTAVAAPITLPVGPLFIQYTNDEQFSITNSIHSTDAATGAVTSEGNWGILQISSIVKGTAQNPPGTDIQGGGANVFSDGGVGGHQITGIFYGTTVNPGGLSAHGGAIDLYWQDVGKANTGADLAAFDPTRRLNQKTYTGYAEPLNPNFIFLAQLVFGPGCDSNPAHNVCTGVAPGTGDGTAKSYQSVNLGRADFGRASSTATSSLSMPTGSRWCPRKISGRTATSAKTELLGGMVAATSSGFAAMTRFVWRPLPSPVR